MKTAFKDVGSEDVNLIKLAGNGLQWWAVVKKVKYRQVL